MAFAEQFTREFRPYKLAAAAGGAVKNQNCVANDAIVIPPRRSERLIMHPQFGERLAGLEMEIPDNKICLARRRILRSNARDVREPDQ